MASRENRKGGRQDGGMGSYTYKSASWKNNLDTVRKISALEQLRRALP